MDNGYHMTDIREWINVNERTNNPHIYGSTENVKRALDNLIPILAHPEDSPMIPANNPNPQTQWMLIMSNVWGANFNPDEENLLSQEDIDLYTTCFYTIQARFLDGMGRYRTPEEIRDYDGSYCQHAIDVINRHDAATAAFDRVEGAPASKERRRLKRFERDHDHEDLSFEDENELLSMKYTISGGPHRLFNMNKLRNEKLEELYTDKELSDDCGFSKKQYRKLIQTLYTDDSIDTETKLTKFRGKKLVVDADENCVEALSVDTLQPVISRLKSFRDFNRRMTSADRTATFDADEIPRQLRVFFDMRDAMENYANLHQLAEPEEEEDGCVVAEELVPAEPLNEFDSVVQNLESSAQELCDGLANTIG